MLIDIQVEADGHAVLGVALKPLGFWDRGFEYR